MFGFNFQEDIVKTLERVGTGGSGHAGADSGGGGSSAAAVHHINYRNLIDTCEKLTGDELTRHLIFDYDVLVELWNNVI
jgi:hypothetical protein